MAHLHEPLIRYLLVIFLMCHMPSTRFVQAGSRDRLPKDCGEVRGRNNGTYVIKPDEEHRFNVLCVFDRDGDWTMLQNNVGHETWARPWKHYRNGFGTMKQEESFWLGLEKMHWLTRNMQRRYVLRVQVSHESDEAVYADYEDFSVADEKNDYFLTYGAFLGGAAGDGLRDYHMNKPFSTLDSDSDDSLGRHCAIIQLGAFWYGDCGYSSLNKGNIYWNERSSFYDRASMLVRALVSDEYDASDESNEN